MMHRKLAVVLLGLLFGVVGSVAANATDLTPTGQTPFAWEGMYFGGSIGGAWTNKDWSIDSVSGCCGSNGESIGSGSASGFLAGLQLGANWMAAPNIIVGVQGNVDWSSLTVTAINPNRGTCARDSSDQTATCTAKLDWQAALTARAGVARHTRHTHLCQGWYCVRERYVQRYEHRPGGRLQRRAACGLQRNSAGKVRSDGRHWR